MRMLKYKTRPVFFREYCELIQELSKIASERRKRLIPVNVTGAITAIVPDMVSGQITIAVSS